MSLNWPGISSGLPVTRVLASIFRVKGLGYFDFPLRPVKIKFSVQEVLCDQRKPTVGTGA